MNYSCILCKRICSARHVCIICEDAIVACYNSTRVDVGFHYLAPVSTLLKMFKYQQNLLAAEVLAIHVARTCGQYIANYDAVIPMPAHRQRIAFRGMHCTDYLIRRIIKHAGIKIPVINTFGWRVVSARPQMELSLNARMANISEKHFQLPYLPQKQYLIFDDVLTTGATVGAFAPHLLERGLLLLAQKSFFLN